MYSFVSVDFYTSSTCVVAVLYLSYELIDILQGRARGLCSRGETVTLKSETKAETEALTIQAETRPQPRPSELETETRPKHTNSEERPSQGTTEPWDGLETEATSHIHIIPRTDVVLKEVGEA